MGVYPQLFNPNQCRIFANLVLEMLDGDTDYAKKIILSDEAYYWRSYEEKTLVNRSSHVKGSSIGPPDYAT